MNPEAKTEGIVKTWPWTNTQSRLASSGYKLALAPLARTKIEWISRPSCSLHTDATHQSSPYDNNIEAATI
ncbi:hypothetical protein PtA15_8A195 [Puccinia triticina]|uniref:Uncharacterized protein n=1 Tax=Puccinia triticina TaxID=208348 RepID=A0ABY7CPW7_9BASI|nr:uncharacterized protein PtA15_8A195 [Puccinia triticina]WAQ87291.1 hypothetical protein PtA15_8A195 [Puccinia triticina]